MLWTHSGSEILQAAPEDSAVQSGTVQSSTVLQCSAVVECSGIGGIIKKNSRGWVVSSLQGCLFEIPAG